MDGDSGDGDHRDSSYGGSDYERVRAAFGEDAHQDRQREQRIDTPVEPCDHPLSSNDLCSLARIAHDGAISLEPCRKVASRCGARTEQDRLCRGWLLESEQRSVQVGASFGTRSKTPTGMSVFGAHAARARIGGTRCGCLNTMPVVGRADGPVVNKYGSRTGSRNIVLDLRCPCRSRLRSTTPI